MGPSEGEVPPQAKPLPQAKGEVAPGRGPPFRQEALGLEGLPLGEVEPLGHVGGEDQGGALGEPVLSQEEGPFQPPGEDPGGG